jgi:peptidoglycan-N-acetylglucosamine deacetylase
MKLITTSWDDGHILDFKLAELLDKYNLQGTFYIPKRNAENIVMSENQIVQLSKQFEIGGHTLNHVRLRKNLSHHFAKEIDGCYLWLNDLLGYYPKSFCFPGGIYNKQAIHQAYKSGFKVLRTTELLSSNYSLDRKLMGTTLQVFEHTSIVYLKHLIKRGRIQNLIRWLSTNSSSDLLRLSDFFLNEVEKNSGCFHIWGHSWEIDKEGLWGKLEILFQHLASRNEFISVTNGGIINIHE